MAAKLEFTFESEEELFKFMNRLKESIPDSELKPVATASKKAKKTQESKTEEPMSYEKEKLVATQAVPLSLEEFRNAATNIRAAKTMMPIKPIMDQFGITKLTDLDPQKYEEFLEALRNG